MPTNAEGVAIIIQTSRGTRLFVYSSCQYQSHAAIVNAVHTAWLA